MCPSTWSFTRVSTGSAWRAWAGLCVALAFLAGPARADGISGRVYGPDGKPLPETVLHGPAQDGSGGRFQD